jgi:site-specific DNA recombinase
MGLGTDRQTPKFVGIWIRVSTEDQVRGESPEHHETRARAYAEAKGWTVAETYRLDAVSGKAVMGHAEAQRMLADVRSGRISALVFSKLARLARNTRELLEFSQIFRKEGADLVSLQESIDTSSPAGRLFFTMIAAMAEWEREEIADRVAASVPVRAALGKSLGGRAPYGYVWRDKVLAVNPDEAPVRKLIYELYLEHGRKKTVAQILTDRGYRTRVGRPFSAMAVEELICDPSAKGMRRANYTTRRNGEYERKPESEWVLTPVPPIVSTELWDACNSLLLSRKSGAPFPGPRPEHLFGGKVRCACGGKMYARKQIGKYLCQVCNRKIPAADLEAIYHSQLVGFLFSDVEIAAHLERSDNEIASREVLLERQKEERAAVQRDLDRLFELYLAGELPKEGFGLKYRPLEARLAQIDTEIASLQAAIDVGKIAKLSQDQVVTEVRTLHARWPDLSHGEKRDIIQAITDEIVIDVDAIDIRLQYQPEGGTTAQKGTYEVGSPLGWLWTRITELADSSSARRMTSRA